MQANIRGFSRFPGNIVISLHTECIWQQEWIWNTRDLVAGGDGGIKCPAAESGRHWVPFRAFGEEHHLHCLWVLLLETQVPDWLMLNSCWVIPDMLFLLNHITPVNQRYFGKINNSVLIQCCRGFSCLGFARAAKYLQIESLTLVFISYLQKQ